MDGEEGWTYGTGSPIPFLALSLTSPMTLDKFQGHQVFMQLLLLFKPRFTQAEQVAEQAGKPKLRQHLGSSF